MSLTTSWSAVARRLMPAGVIVLCAVIFFWPFFGEGKFFVAADTLFSSFPWRAYAPPNFQPHNTLITDPVNHNWAELYNRQLKGGDLKNWNPYLLLGIPATGASAMSGMSGRNYPVKLLAHRLFDTATAHSLLLFLHVLLAGLAMYALLRTLGAGVEGGLFGAVAWMFNGCAMVWLEFETTVAVSAYLPLVVLCLERLYAGPGLRWALAGGLALGVFTLAGHLQYLIYAFLLMGAHLVWSLSRAARGGAGRRELPRLLAGYGLVGVLGVLIGAVDLIPLAELLNNSGRIARRFEFQNFFETLGRVPWRYYVTLVYPDWFGSPPLGFNVVPALPTQEYMNYCELTFYAGVPTLFGFLAALVSGTPGARRFFLAVTAVSAALMSGTFFYYPFFLLVPGMNRMNPTRLVWLFDFAFVVAAGLGIGALRGLSSRRRLWFVAAVATAVAAVAALAILGQSAAANTWFNAEIFASGYGGVAGLLETIRKLRNISSPVVLKPLLITGAAAALVLWIALARAGRNVLVSFALLIGLLAFDLISFGRGFNTVSEPSQIFPKTPAIAFLLSQPRPYRVLLGPGTFINSLAPFGIESLDGYSSFYPEGTNALLSFVQNPVGARAGTFRFDRWVSLSNPDSPALDFMNVRFVLARPGTPPPGPRFRLVFLQNELAIFENTTALPRAWVVPDAVVFQDRLQALAHITSPGFDPRREVVLEDSALARAGAGAGFGGGIPGVAMIEHWGEDDVLVATQSAAPAWLMLADTWYPGWTVTVNGAPAPILRGNVNFRAVRIPAGRCSVVFSYRPAAVRWGTALSLLGIALPLAGSGFWWVRRRGRAEAA